MARQIGQQCIFGSLPKEVGQPQYILLRLKAPHVFQDLLRFITHISLPSLFLRLLFFIEPGVLLKSICGS